MSCYNNWLLHGVGDMLSNGGTNGIDKNMIHMADTKKLAEIAKMKTRPLLPLKNNDIEEKMDKDTVMKIWEPTLAKSGL